ncbi:MAG: carbamoyltransferase HypF, partial [Saprospiraceae bacterium]|nr:carbamoyltransferase HypF [Saprospiraceae bacterium]
MKTWHIHMEGQVQGVGFRPYIFQLATEMGLNGWVRNGSNGVHIEINASAEICQDFVARIMNHLPYLAVVTKHKWEEVSLCNYQEFRIIDSGDDEDATLILTPDLAICAACRSELNQKGNRRYYYPFITCTHCGPRYSIMNVIPYDRVNTAMAPFVMCKHCKEEYHDPLNRRFYAQTNSCPECPIELFLYDQDSMLVASDPARIIDRVIIGWEQGEIIAIKGIGGFLLTCSASDKSSIERLRLRKHRPSKPLAMMIPSSYLENNKVVLRQEEKELLTHFSSPIVLISQDNFNQSPSPLPWNAIAPGLHRVGVMIPYTPLLEMLLTAFGQPVIATSGNISHAPIIYESENALADLSSVADLILDNNRAILIPEDDSVIGFTALGRKIIFRRSRGLAPTYINPRLQWPDKQILAMGAMLKSTICYLHRAQPYISQYLGDLENFETYQHYRHTLKHFLRLFRSSPSVIITDKHPDYPSTHIGNELAGENTVPLIAVQHHMAHFAAILAEHNLHQLQHNVLGVIWDGTGLGDDGQIWGGEFFQLEKGKIHRIGYVQYFDQMLGDKMAKEPRISALSVSWKVPGYEQLEKKFPPVAWQNYQIMLTRGSSIKSSSMGRVFDGVASILDIMDVQSFEGEAAGQLEAVAKDYLDKNPFPDQNVYQNLIQYELGNFRVDMATLMEQIFQDRSSGLSSGLIAFKFHNSLAHLIEKIAEKKQIKHLA